MKLKLTNTLSREQEIFKPISNDKVLMYVCGITPYDFSHIGHGRCYVSFDVLFRLLKFLGYKVNYVRNFTDIDDKILAKADREGKDYKQISEEFIKQFHEDMFALNCLHPTKEPKVTENIGSIIKFVKELIDKGFAYIANGDIYFDVKKFKDYGKLSGRNLDELQAGARVDVNEIKQNPADFALWKGNDQELFWRSPWGYGRPGWHIECSVMAKDFLGENIDIHGGGQDLIFPHHENEIAQSESIYSKPFAKYWVHNAFVNIDKEKMSKSLGNILSLQEIFKKFDPMVLRFYFLQHQYTTPLEFSFENLKAAQTAYKKLVNAFKDVDDISVNVEKIELRNDFTTQVLQALCDDLNTPKALGFVFENLDSIKKDEQSGQVIKYLLTNIFGLTLKSLKEKEIKITPEIEELIKQREEARINKDFELADQIRDKLKLLGFEVKDKKID
ncbi:MAG: cysteine--tRNA ligase [bacterium]